MKTNLTCSIVLLAILFVTSCRSNPSNFEGGGPTGNMADMKTMDAAAPPSFEAASVQESEVLNMPNSGSGIGDVAAITRKIIRDGRMEIRVKELNEGKREIDSLVSRFKGYYSDETFNNLDYTHSYNLKIRIPSVRFDSFIAEIESSAGEVVFKNISSRDVTEEFIDLETRLKNKRNYLTRYSDLLKQAKSVKDILEIEEKTRLIEEEIESVQGRLKYLNSQVDFSTLDLLISKKNDYNPYRNNDGSFIDRLKLSLVKGWFGLVAFTLFVIRIWPFWLIVAALYYTIRKLVLRRRNRKK